MIRYALFAVVWSWACGSSKPATVPASVLDVSIGKVTVPMRLVRHVPLVRVNVDEGDPVWFVLDTGAPISVIAKRIAGRMTKEAGGEDVHVSGTTPGAFDTAAFRFNRLHLGKLPLDNVDAIVTDLASLDERIGVQIGGILGFAPFKDLVLTLDYPHAQVIVEAGELPQPNGRDILALHVHALHPSIVLPIAGTDTITEVDSGSGFFMEVATSIATRLTFRAPPVPAAHAIGISGLSEQRAAKLAGDVRLGTQTMRAPLIYLGDDPSLDTDGVARIGGPLLAHFAVSFDQRTEAVRFARAETDAIDFGPLKSIGIELVKRANGWEIVGLVANTPAAGLGLLLGDVITTVNGKATAEFDAEDWDLATYAPVPLNATVIHDGQPRDLVVPIALLVP